MKSLKDIINNFQHSYDNLLKNQNHKKLKQGCYVYELEADTTITSEYILLMHFLGKIEIKLQEKMVKYILSKQNQEGGWPLFYDGETDLSASVKAYYALKLAGLDKNSREMIKAKKCILLKGGVEKVNVFTRITLALYGQITWSSIPFMPIEIMFFPNWFPFNIYKISYWSRTVLVPLLIIMRRKPIAQNPNRVFIKELFKNPKNHSGKIKLISKKKFLSKTFIYLDKLARFVFSFLTKGLKDKCENFALKWILKRLNGLDGLGGIFPAMVNALIALTILDKNKYAQEIKIAQKAIDKLIVEKKDYAYCQPCFSPVWDSGWMGIVNIENGILDDRLAEWFLKKEIKIKGDWSHKNSEVDEGGWAFQFNNDYYPDVDDTALVGMFLDRYNRIKKKNPYNLQSKELENGLLACNLRMEVGVHLILIMYIILLIQYHSLTMGHYLIHRLLTFRHVALVS